MSTSNLWIASYNEIKSQYYNTTVIVESGIRLEQDKKNNEALDLYKQAIEIIDYTLNIHVIYPENPDETWEEAICIIKELKKIRGDLLARINQITQITTSSIEDLPPSYEEATRGAPKTYTELAEALRSIDINADVKLEAEVIFMYEDVELYFVSSDDQVSSTKKLHTLKITLVEGEKEDDPRAILEIGDLVYPLIPGVSPCYRSDFGAFILPDINAPGSSIGIILPSDAEPSAYATLENILYGIVNQTPSSFEKVDTSKKISNGLVSSANYFSDRLKSGSEKVGHLMNKNTTKLIKKIKSNEKNAEVPRSVTRGVKIAENTTHKAAEITTKLAKKVGVATVSLARFLAPHVQKGGTRVLTTGFRMKEEDASSKMKGVMRVTAGAVEGFSTVYCGLEHSAFILGKSLKDNTVKVVQHKYGEPAGDVASDSLEAVGNVLHASHNVKIVQPAYFAKRATKEAGKIMIYERGQKNETNKEKKVEKK